MSESHYWPKEPGEYLLETRRQNEGWWSFDGNAWSRKPFPKSRYGVQELIEYGYLGVRREQQKIDEHAEEIAQLKADAAKARADVFDWMRVVSERDAEIKQLRDEIARVDEQASTPDLTALIREAIAEFRRDVKQPTQAADWAFEWVNRFIEVVEVTR